MDAGLKEAFCNVKPFCDVVMVNPSAENVSLFQEAIKNLDKKVIQDMQLYILYPVITHLKPSAKRKPDIDYQLINIMKFVMENSSVTSVEIFTKFHNCLLSIIFDRKQTGMVAEGPEELKLSLIESLIAMMLNMEDQTRLKLFQNFIPLLAQTVFVTIHIAKLEKLRKLRIAAMDCVQAYTGTHPDLSDQLKLHLENAAVELVSSILPGVAGALLEVATDRHNPGHGVIVTAIKCLHNIICLVMNNKHLDQTKDVSVEDFARIIQLKAKADTENVNNKEKSPKDVAKLTPEWYTLAGKKLEIVMSNIASIQTHSHPAVRKELAVLFVGILMECSRTMQPSLSIAVHGLISLSKDEYADIAQYCATELDQYAHSIPPKLRYSVMDNLADNFMCILATLPRILNNIDSRRKLSTLNLIHGLIQLMAPHLGDLLEVPRMLATLCDVLVEAARIDVDTKLLAITSVTQIEPPPQLGTLPWCVLRHMDDQQCVQRLQDVCRLLGDNTRVVTDRLLDVLVESTTDRNEVLYLLNLTASASKDEDVIKLVLDIYLDLDLWYLPVEVRSREHAAQHTMDVDVYNPRSWDKDYVPGLFEGAIETRYTDISYQFPRVAPSGYDVTLSTAISNMASRCLLTQGVGKMAVALGDKYQPYLMKMLCLVLERIGSKYEMLHLSGVLAIHDVARACSHGDVYDLIRGNADYFTYQVTTRLKKVWNSQSALEMLTVVMQYSDNCMFHCFYGIVSDVLLQSCEKYHEQDLTAYLKVFLTFITCIQKWFPKNENILQPENPTIEDNNELFGDTLNYIKSNQFDEEAEGVDEEIESKDDGLEFEEHENIENESDPPLPPLHIQMTEKILKRCLNFAPSKRMTEKLIALEILDKGLLVMADCDKLLYPMVHLIWSPLVERFRETRVTPVMIKAIGLLKTMTELTKDFVAKRTVEQVLPILTNFLNTSLTSSHLKDTGSAYRLSPEYKLQIAALSVLPTLVVELNLTDTSLEQCVGCCGKYLSNKQPKPLQDLAVKFFRTCLVHEYGEIWHYLRKLCDNDAVLQPPGGAASLAPLVGTPYQSTDNTYNANIKLIFDLE